MCVGGWCAGGAPCAESVGVGSCCTGGVLRLNSPFRGPPGVPGPWNLVDDDIRRDRGAVGAGSKLNLFGFLEPKPLMF